ncbi:uncharacterized protein LOC122812880 [Protopterus annectens]|uniref:uncharacterized protein LOC122812880 n=1 Tax=Protopterus annectens TaxID=7888 RepID=UPI001CFBE94B|nr:uncharacterized protein LOC122812880 [Protopterus annectens]
MPENFSCSYPFCCYEDEKSSPVADEVFPIVQQALPEDTVNASVFQSPGCEAFNNDEDDDIQNATCFTGIALAFSHVCSHCAVFIKGSFLRAVSYFLRRCQIENSLPAPCMTDPHEMPNEQTEDVMKSPPRKAKCSFSSTAEVPSQPSQGQAEDVPNTSTAECLSHLHTVDIPSRIDLAGDRFSTTEPATNLSLTAVASETGADPLDPVSQLIGTAQYLSASAVNVTATEESVEIMSLMEDTPSLRARPRPTEAIPSEQSTSSSHAQTEERGIVYAPTNPKSSNNCKTRDKEGQDLDVHSQQQKNPEHQDTVDTAKYCWYHPSNVESVWQISEKEKKNRNLEMEDSKEPEETESVYLPSCSESSTSCKADNKDCQDLDVPSQQQKNVHCQDTVDTATYYWQDLRNVELHWQISEQEKRNRILEMEGSKKPGDKTNLPRKKTRKMRWKKKAAKRKQRGMRS